MVELGRRKKKTTNVRLSWSKDYLGIGKASFLHDEDISEKTNFWARGKSSKKFKILESWKIRDENG